MAEHLIRLRGGWECHDRHNASDPPSRMTLPCHWTAGATGLVRLVRRFQTPSIDCSGESLSLRMESVAGLVAAWLNDREIARPVDGVRSIDVALRGPLRPRNVLELEVDRDHAGSLAAWGEIALVIAPADVHGKPGSLSGE